MNIKTVCLVRDEEFWPNSIMDGYWEKLLQMAGYGGQWADCSPRPALLSVGRLSLQSAAELRTRTRNSPLFALKRTVLYACDTYFSQ
ncbi:hypothetical protein LDENG_00054200 [Lucifuga dentata]|nr:hypothetical protein LDENG_00054200 [Lucifuga dentata]